MARPAAPPGRKKSRKLSARFNAAEARIVADRAREDGMTVSDELRRAVGLPPRKPPVELELLSRLIGHISKVGSNLNQLARTANEGSWPEEAAIRQSLADVAAMRGALMKALRIDDPGLPPPPAPGRP